MVGWVLSFDVVKKEGLLYYSKQNENEKENKVGK
jgi:hypothetical protein